MSTNSNAKTDFKSLVPLSLLIAFCVAGLYIKPQALFDGTKDYNGADIAWVLVSSALVFLMTPALAFFYGGMVNRKNILSTMYKSFIATAVVSIMWVAFGFSMSFGDSICGIIGDPRTYMFFKGVASSHPWSLATTIPLMLFAVFQLKFAIITPGLVVGAVVERIKFITYILFVVLFFILIYCPVAHWAWHPEGLLFGWGVLDFAGGTVVHITAGCAALAGALVLKQRRGAAIQPSNIPYILIGTGLLWFGWFGFNAGSALGAGGLAVSAFLTTNTAAAVAGFTWILIDAAFRGKKPSVMGFCIGVVVGLVAITPGAGYVDVAHSGMIGMIAAVISNIAVGLQGKTKLDDPLDVFACHGLGGIVGMLLVGVFASHEVNAAVPLEHQGLLFGGDPTLFIIQLEGMLTVAVYSFIVSYIIFFLLDKIMGLRVSAEDEEEGLDISQHGEAYKSRSNYN